MTTEKREELKQLRAQADIIVDSATNKSSISQPNRNTKTKKIGKILWKNKGLIFAALAFVFSLFGIEASADETTEDFGFDTDGDGDIDTWGVDTDGDGIIDTVGSDTNRDGIIDSIGMDSNADGALDTVVQDGRNGAKELLMDTDGDGFVDTVAVDLDGDGTIDAIN